MSTNNRTCVICARSYHACKDCEDAAKIGNYRWRNSCDKPECFQVLLVLTDFYYDRITKYQAREMLIGILSDDMLPYDPQAKVLIDRIYDDDPVPETTEMNISQEESVAEQNISAVGFDEESIEPIAADDEIIKTVDNFIPNDEPEVVINEIYNSSEIGE